MPVQFNCCGVQLNFLVQIGIEPLADSLVDQEEFAVGDIVSIQADVRVAGKITVQIPTCIHVIADSGHCLFRTGSMPTRRARSDVNRPSGSSRCLISRRSR